MKFKSGVVLTESGNNTYLAASGEAGGSFKGMMKLNKSAAYIAGLLQNETDMEKIIASMLEKYEVTENIARENAERAVKTFKDYGLISD